MHDPRTVVAGELSAHAAQLADCQDKLAQAEADVATMDKTTHRLTAELAAKDAEIARLRTMEGRSCPNCGGGPLEPETEPSAICRTPMSDPATSTGGRAGESCDRDTPDADGPLYAVTE